MGLWAYLKTNFFLHVLLGYVFIVSGLIVCFCMLLTYICVWPWNKVLYRKIVANLAYAHWCQFVFLAQWWAGSDTVIFMENPEDFEYVGKEHHIVVANHKYDIDWLALWIVAERTQMLGGTKIYGKSVLRWVPLIGWAWMFTESIFLKRQWDQDKKIISRDLAYLTEYPPGYWVTLLLFPEGTRFTEEKHKKSMEVARKKGLPELKHHLLPRTKGFIQSMYGVKGKMHSILDVTIAFREKGFTPSFLSTLRGKAFQAEIYTRRIPLEEVPIESEQACSDWLHKLFQEKDEIFEHFVQNGCFKIGKPVVTKRRANDLIVWLLWFVSLMIPLCKYLTSVVLTGSITLQVTLLLIIVLGSIGLRQMIAVSETEKGSTYGQHNKSTDSNMNENKKQQ